MFSNNRTIPANDDAVSIGLHLHGPPHGTRGDRVSDIIEAHEAGLRDCCGAGMESIEAADILNQMLSFGFKHLPDHLIHYLRMLVGFGVSNTLVEQQAVELLQALDPQDWWAIIYLTNPSVSDRFLARSKANVYSVKTLLSR
jgi:hypothetical protein